MIESAVARERTNVLPGNTRLLTDVRVGGRGRREAVPRLGIRVGIDQEKATTAITIGQLVCFKCDCGRPSRLLP